jgi:two-component system LytT family response regulator
MKTKNKDDYSSRFIDIQNHSLFLDNSNLPNPNMLKALIIDDEEAAQRSLDKLIQLYHGGKVQVVDIAGSLKEGLVKIRKIKPEVVFLDIEMPIQNGLELFDYIEEINFEVVITTAYKDYAIEALRLGATDYLLKPININELANCINRIEARQKSQLSLNNEVKYQTGKLMVPYQKGYYVIAFTDILAIEASGNYSCVYKKNGENLFVTRPIGAIEQILPSTYFFRVHRSSLVNINFVTGLDKELGVVTVSTIQQPLSEKNIKPLIEKLKEILDVEIE